MEDDTSKITNANVRHMARILGDMLADAGDFYDVLEEICIGYANGVTGRFDGLASPVHTSLVKSPAGPAVGAEANFSSDQGAGYPRSKSHLRWQLVAANELSSVATNWRAQLVVDAREEHWTWQEVGDALEISRQAAQQRYGSFGAE
jgi:hypothetical protein